MSGLCTAVKYHAPYILSRSAQTIALRICASVWEDLSSCPALWRRSTYNPCRCRSFVTGTYCKPLPPTCYLFVPQVAFQIYHGSWISGNAPPIPPSGVCTSNIGQGRSHLSIQVHTYAVQDGAVPVLAARLADWLTGWMGRRTAVVVIARLTDLLFHMSSRLLPHVGLLLLGGLLRLLFPSPSFSSCSPTSAPCVVFLPFTNPIFPTSAVFTAWCPWTSPCD